jgi:DNA-binding MurR/RpiR family transcriptional regulator
MALFLEIQKNKSNTPVERAIIDYIITYPNEVVEMSMEELSSRTYTSRSSIARFCRKNGFKGFNDFKIQLAIELNTYLSDLDNNDSALPFSKNDEDEEIIEKVITANIYSMQETMRVNHPSRIVKAAIKISEASSVVFIGVQHSGIVAYGSHIRLSSMGFNSRCFVTESEIITYSYFAKPEDVVVLFCYSGMTSVILEAAQYCKQRNATTICVTGNRNCDLMNLSDISLLINSTDDPNNNLSLSSITPMITLMNAIFCLILNNSSNDSYDRLAQITSINSKICRR